VHFISLKPGTEDRAAIFAVFTVLLAVFVFIHLPKSPTAFLPLSGSGSELAGWWNFDEGAGTAAADLSGNGNNCQLAGNASYIAGKYGSAISFDGLGDYIDCAGTANFTSSDFTISYWVNLDTFHTNKYPEQGGTSVIFKGRFNTSGYYDYITDEGGIIFITSQSGASQSTTTNTGLITTGTWHHITHVRSGSTVTVYINGADATNSHGTHIDPASSSYNFTPGVYDPGNYNFFADGAIDDLRIYNRTLNPSEVRDLFSLGANPQGAPSNPDTVNGSCGVSLNLCSRGNLNDIDDSSTQFLWNCVGSNGGTTASCSEPITQLNIPSIGSIISSERSTDWAGNAGVNFSIPDYNSVACTGLFANGTTDDTAKIQTCLNNASPGTAVLIPAGTYKLDGRLYIDKSIVLRGAGPSQTILKGNGTIYMAPNRRASYDNMEPFSSARTINAGLSQGSRTLTLSSVSGLSPGTYVSIYENIEPNPPVDPSGANGNNCDSWCGDQGKYNGSITHFRGQINKILKVGPPDLAANQILLERPLYWTLSSGNGPRLRKWTTGMLERAGVENLKITHEGLSPSLTGHSIEMGQTANSWVKNVEVAYLKNYGIALNFSYGNVITQSYIHHGTNYEGDRAYGINVWQWNSDHYIYNNIFYYLRHSIFFNGGGSGVIVAFNQSSDTHGTAGATEYVAQDFGYHGAYPFMNLFENNEVFQLSPDNYFGSSGYTFWFRNNASGKSAWQADTAWGHWAVNNMRNQFYGTYIGNVFGYPAMSGWTYESNGACWENRTLLRWGCVDNSGTGTNHQPQTKNTAVIFGNYDYLHACTWDETAGRCLTSSEVSNIGLPASLFLSSPPSWWGSTSWPPVGPDITGNVSDIAARKCFFNSNLASGGSFNPTSCYGGGVASPVNGLCGSGNNSCSQGTLNDVADSSTQFLWNCNGFNGGSNASCSLAKDTVAPVRGNGSPSGALSIGTTTTMLSLTTNESATCKYSTTPGALYGSMSGTFTTTGATTHSRSLTGLVNGTSYNYYVKCQDGTGNSNTDDFPISFSVASSPLTTVTIASNKNNILENTETAVVTFTHNGTTQNSLTINYTITGSATNGGDYQQISPTITIPSGTNNTTLQIIPLDDLAVEGTENLTLTITPTAFYTTNQQNTTTINITDNDTLAGLLFEAENGEISAPLAITQGHISQSSVALTNPLEGGRAVYRFNINQAGDYIIKADVSAATTASDSFFINIDSEPQSPTHIWDIIPLTTGFEERTISWRGSGIPTIPQFSPKIFTLSTGEHQLTLRGREANTQLDKISIVKYFAPKCLSPLATISQSLINIYNCPLPIANEFDIKPDFANLDLNNLTALELGIGSYGKITFENQNLKLVRETNNQQNRLDLDSAIEITQGKITLNPAVLPELNKPATLTLYNINYNNPKILKDGVACSQCLITTYNKNTQTISFTIPGFSTYEIVEDTQTDTENVDQGTTPDYDPDSTDSGDPDSSTPGEDTSESGSAGGGGSGTGSEGYKASTRNLEITPLQIGKETTITTTVSHAIPTPQNFTLQLKITQNNQTIFIDTATINNLPSGKAQKIIFPNKWTPTQIGDYNATILLYAKETLYDKQTKKITITSTQTTIKQNPRTQDQNIPQQNNKLWDYNLNPEKDTNAQGAGQPLEAAQIGIILIILVALAAAVQGIIIIRKGQ